MYIKNVLIIIVLLIGEGTVVSANDTIGITGKWTGVSDVRVGGKGSSFEVIIHLSRHEGKRLTGKYWDVTTGVEADGKGEITGDNSFYMKWYSTTISCPGTYSHDYMFSRDFDRITWVFRGEDCRGSKAGYGNAKRLKTVVR